MAGYLNYNQNPIYNVLKSHAPILPAVGVRVHKQTNEQTSKRNRNVIFFTFPLVLMRQKLSIDHIYQT